MKPLKSMVWIRFSLVNSRAVCGARSPMKLISPVKLIMDATVKVAVNSTIKRRAVTETPSIRASPSSVERTRTCRCSKNKIHKQTTHKIRLAAIEYPLIPLKLPIIQYSIDASSRSGSAVSFKHIKKV